MFVSVVSSVWGMWPEVMVLDELVSVVVPDPFVTDDVLLTVVSMCVTDVGDVEGVRRACVDLVPACVDVVRVWSSVSGDPEAGCVDVGVVAVSSVLSPGDVGSVSDVLYLYCRHSCSLAGGERLCPLYLWLASGDDSLSYSLCGFEVCCRAWSSNEV